MSAIESTPTLPVPPAKGWSLVEAAEALLPELMQRVLAREDFFPALRLVGGDLMHALLAREDLCLTGYDEARPLDAAPVTLPRRLFDSVSFLHLLVDEDRLRVRRMGRGEWEYLTRVRVQLALHAAGADTPASNGATEQPSFQVALRAVIARLVREDSKLTIALAQAAAEKELGTTVPRDTVAKTMQMLAGGARTRGRKRGKSDAKIAADRRRPVGG